MCQFGAVPTYLNISSVVMYETEDCKRQEGERQSLKPHHLVLEDAVEGWEEI